MKITCQACAAKYTIADDKVLGKVVKIRCKKCGATIVVNGNEQGAGAAADAGRAFDYAGQGGQGDTWTVNVADGDQRTMTDGEIGEAYRAGVVSDETYCWKDGMTDWLPLREIEPLYASCSATRAVAPSDEAGPTRIQQAGPGMFGSGAPTGAASAYAAPRPAAGMAAAQPYPGAGNGALAAAAAASPAARRQGGRAPQADLFGTAAQAGGEEDVMTSAPVGMPEVHDDGKLTGARNENSVLFSLNALTSKGPGGPPGRPLPASSEASGLIDIRQLSSQIGIEEKKKSRIDDIMNLAGGGAFSPSLSAPILSAPPIEEYAPAPSMSPGGTGAMPTAGKNKAVVFGAIGAGVVVIVGAIGLAVMFMGGKSDKDKTAASASATDTTSPPSSALAMNTTPAGTATGATPTDTASAAGTASAPADTSTAGTPPTATTKTTATTATTKPSATHEHEHEPPPPAATHEAAPPAAAGGVDTPFNMGEAKARLASIAGSVQSCKKGDASGSGRVVVTFAPGGNAASAVVQGPPFAGTPTGACVASRFHGAHVPAFSGSPFSVSKSFTIN
jgi:predicted Zn finger-like uncharacterized protein